MKILITIILLFWSISWITLYFRVTKQYSPYTITSFFFYFYLLVIHIGTFVLYLKLDPISIFAMKMTNDTVLLKMLLLANIFLPTFVVSIWFTDNIINGTKKSIYTYYKKRRIEDFTPSQIKNILTINWILFFFTLYAFSVYIKNIPEIPIIAVITGTAENAVLLRQESVGDLFYGKLWIYKLFYQDILIIVNLITGLLYFRYGGKSKKLFIVSSFWLFFVLIFSGAKAPFVIYMLVFISGYYFLKNKSIDKKTILTLLFSLLVLIVWLFIAYKYLMGRESNIEIWTEMIHRAFTGQLQGLYAIIEKFENNLLWGRSFPPFLVKFFNGDYYNLDAESKYYIHYFGMSNLKYIGLAPTIYWGEFFANFGYVGSIISMFLIPIFLREIEVFLFLKVKKNIVNIALLGYLVHHFYKWSSGRMTSNIIDIKLYVVLLIIFVINKIVQKSK